MYIFVFPGLVHLLQSFEKKICKKYKLNGTYNFLVCVNFFLEAMRKPARILSLYTHLVTYIRGHGEGERLGSVSCGPDVGRGAP